MFIITTIVNESVVAYKNVPENVLRTIQFKPLKKKLKIDFIRDIFYLLYISVVNY